MQSKESATQAIFDNLPFVVEKQTYSQSRFNTINAKVECINIVHSKLNELQQIVKDYVKSFHNSKVSNVTGGFFHKFENGLPKVPKWDETNNRMNCYFYQSYKSVYLKCSATVYHKSLTWNGQEADEHLTFEANMFLGTVDDDRKLIEINQNNSEFPLYNFEQVKEQLIKIDQLKRFLSSQESLQGSFMFQNML